jgi:hypothetical protein
MHPTDVSVVNADNDTAGIAVAPTTGLVTSESGGVATFTVKLTSQPLANVVVPVASNNTAEGTVSTPSLTFTAANWNVAQTVTVTGVDDLVRDGDIAYSVVLGVAASGDPAYSGVNPADVSVTNTDDELAGFTATPPAGLVTTEAAAETRSRFSSPAGRSRASVRLGRHLPEPCGRCLSLFAGLGPQTVAGRAPGFCWGRNLFTVVLGAAGSGDPMAIRAGTRHGCRHATPFDVCGHRRFFTVAPLTSSQRHRAFTVKLLSSRSRMRDPGREQPHVRGRGLRLQSPVRQSGTSSERSRSPASTIR